MDTTIPWDGYKRIKRFLTDHGYKKYGEGAYAEVWKSDSAKRIVKFALRPDPCYFAFVKWAQKNPSYHLPKFYGVHGYTASNGMNVFMITTEVLEPLSKYDWSNRTKTIYDFAFYIWFIHHVMEDENKCFEEINEHWLLLEKSPETQDLNTPKENLNFLCNYAREYHPFAKLAVKIENTNFGQCNSDLHHENVMYRPSTDSLVIIDPVATWESENG